MRVFLAAMVVWARWFRSFWLAGVAFSWL